MVSLTLRFPKFFVERYKNTNRTVEREVRDAFFGILKVCYDQKDYHILLGDYMNVSLNLYLSKKQYELFRILKGTYRLSYNELIKLTLFYWFGCI